MGAIDNNSYRQLSGNNQKVSGVQLRKLRLAGIIEQKNSGKYTYYLPGSEFLKTLPGKTISTQPEVLSAQPDALPTQPDTLSTQLGDISSFPLDLQEKLSELGARSNNPEEIPALIEELCYYQPLSIKELSNLLRRNEKHIKREYIAPLMQAGKLVYTIPEIPHHPDQKYSSENSDKI